MVSHSLRRERKRTELLASSCPNTEQMTGIWRFTDSCFSTCSRFSGRILITASQARSVRRAHRGRLKSSGGQRSYQLKQTPANDMLTLKRYFFKLSISAAFTPFTKHTKELSAPRPLEGCGCTWKVCTEDPTPPPSQHKVGSFGAAVSKSVHPSEQSLCRGIYLWAAKLARLVLSTSPPPVQAAQNPFSCA